MPSKTASTSHRRAITLDVEKYQRMLDAPHLSEGERQQMIEVLWSIVVSFVDLGFEVKATENSCGQDTLDGEAEHHSMAGMVELPLHLNDSFNEKTASPNSMTGGGKK